MDRIPPYITFRDVPIRRKLMIVIMVTITVAMALACAGILTSDSLLYRTTLKRDLSALARITAENSTASLVFNDSRTATVTLNALRARTHLVKACIYRLDGTILARYLRNGEADACPNPDTTDSLRFEGDDATVASGIVLDGKRVGTLMLLYDLGEIDERRQLFGIIVFGVLLFSSLIAFLLSSGLRARIADPISQLVRATTAVAETNDYSIRARKVSGDELGVLVDRFNEMLAGIHSRDNSLTKALVDREEALREAEKARERFRFLAESMPQKVFTATPAGDPTYFNRQWIEFTGLTPEQLEHRGWLAIIHPDDVEATTQAWHKSLENGEPLHIQHRLRRADKIYRWHLTRIHAMRDIHGNTSIWIGSLTDIQEQKETEDELRHANDDLQQFAYSASHDLQEPIRNVTVYSELIARRYQDKLDADGQKFLGFLSEGGRRLSMLIHDLLAYTRAGAVEREITPLDSNVVLAHALSSLAEAIRENNATVTYDPLPEVQMGETHLHQVLQNLIINSLKYRSEESPRIHISAVDLVTAWRFSVKDNGIGIDPAYKERIFGLFKRLHRDHQGTGIGLAICQRVIERYGGRIWVESQVGKGATFYFTIPRYGEGLRESPAPNSAR